MTPRVFLSRPAVLSALQARTSGRWCTALSASGIEVDQLPRTRYGGDPWCQLRDCLEQVDGVVVLGFAQLEAPTTRWRAGTPEETAGAACWTSPWMQIEAGMAVATGLPVLVAADPSVREGVFDPEIHGDGVYGVGLGGPCLTGAAADLWHAAVMARWASHHEQVG